MHQSNEALHAERATVATILQNPEFLTQLPEKVNIAAFQNPANRAIVQLALQLYNDGYRQFDSELLKNRVTLMPVSGIQVSDMQNYVVALLTADIASVNFTKYLSELQEAHLHSEMSKLLHSSIADLGHVDMDPSMLMAKLQTKLYELDAGINKNEDATNIGMHVEETILGLLEEPKLGIPTGIDVLDEMTLGLLKKKFYFVGARPGEGKTAFMTQVGLHAAYFAKEKRVPVLYIDTEIEDEEFEIRNVGHLAGVDTKIIQTGRFGDDPETKENVLRATHFIKKHGNIYHIELPSYSIANVVNLMRRYVYNYGVGLVIFDQIEEPAYEGDKKARWERVGLLARTLKQQAQILDIPVLAALQQNKKGADKSRVSSEAYAESDDVFKKADGAWALNSKSAAEIREETIQAGTHRLQILKGRYHAASYYGLNLRYVGYCLRFWPAQIQGTDQPEETGNDGDNSNEYALPVASENLTAPLV